MVAPCLVAALLSGCTARQSRGQYEERLAHAVETRNEVSAKLDSRSYADRAAYAAAASDVQSAFDELDADPPPRAAEAAHERMLHGLEGLGILLGRLGRCEDLATRSEQDGRACRSSIRQSVYDEIRNDFTEADTIYREEGFVVPGLGAADERGSDEPDDVLDDEEADGGDDL